MPARPVQLVDQRLGPEAAVLGARQHAQGVVAHDGQAAPGLGQPLPDQRITSAAVLACPRHQPLELVAKLHLLAQGRDATLEAEQRHGNTPAVAGRAENIVGRGHGIIEEHLVELRGAGKLLDGAHCDARLVHRHQQEGEPLPAPALGVGASDDEAPVRLVGQGRPDLLAVENPLSRGLVQAGTCTDVGQVGACPGLRIALTPELTPLDDAGQETATLSFATEGGNGRASESFADVAHSPWAAGAGILLVEDHLLADRQAPPAMLRCPAHAGPATLGEVAFPGLALFGEGVLIAGATAKAQRGKLTLEVGLEPACDLVTKSFVVTAETDLHYVSPNSSRTICSRCQAGVPR